RGGRSFRLSPGRCPALRAPTPSMSRGSLSSAISHFFPVLRVASRGRCRRGRRLRRHLPRYHPLPQVAAFVVPWSLRQSGSSFYGGSWLAPPPSLPDDGLGSVATYSSGVGSEPKWGVRGSPRGPT